MSSYSKHCKFTFYAGEPDLAASLEHFSHLSREINGMLCDTFLVSI